MKLYRVTLSRSDREAEGWTINVVAECYGDANSLAEKYLDDKYTNCIVKAIELINEDLIIQGLT